MKKLLLISLILIKSFVLSDTSYLNDKEIVALTLLMEARGEEKEYKGMAAVAQVILNRVNSPEFPNNARQVCLQYKQFSCWLRHKDRGYYEQLMAIPLAAEAFYYASLVLNYKELTEINQKYHPEYKLVIDKRGEDCYFFYAGNKYGGKRIGNHYFRQNYKNEK